VKREEKKELTGGKGENRFRPVAKSIPRSVSKSKARGREGGGKKELAEGKRGGGGGVAALLIICCALFWGRKGGKNQKKGRKEAEAPSARSLVLNRRKLGKGEKGRKNARGRKREGPDPVVFFGCVPDRPSCSECGRGGKRGGGKKNQRGERGGREQEYLAWPISFQKKKGRGERKSIKGRKKEGEGWEDSRARF